MHCKKACLVINPRAGENIAKLGDLIAVLSAAGWSTDIALKEYGGHTLKLATKAAEHGHDLVIAYGGDGTLNQVVNGVMNVKGQHSTVGVIPGGTTNVWAGEVGVPVDPVKSALTLVNSEARKVDIGHVEVEGLTFPGAAQNDHAVDQINSPRKGNKSRKGKASSKARHHFLLMAGLGIDAAVMGHVSKPLKYRIGRLAVGISATEELPKQYPFPIEIRAAGSRPDGELLWKGEALQVVIGNTREYANIVELTPNAYIDDGVLDICVITAGNPLTTMEQIVSLLLRRKPDNLTTEYFHGAHFSISVPATIDLQLDGSAVKLKDYLNKSDRQALEEERDAEQVMVNYRFDAMPRALHIAIPHTYNDTLFEHTAGEDKSHAELEQHADEVKAANRSYEHAGKVRSEAEEQRLNEENTPPHNNKHSSEEPHELPEIITQLMHQGRKVTVVGVSPNPDKHKQTYIVAGGTHKGSTGEIKPVAVRIHGNTTVLRHSGESATLALIGELREGAEIVIEGKQSKRGVISAKRVVV
jgi:YegS/Rv2252/BmrU family lipid kinase